MTIVWRRLIGGVMAAAALSGPAQAAAQTAAAAPPCPGPRADGASMRDLGRPAPHLLLDEDFPDPFVARFGQSYFAYGTGVAGRHVQLVRSRDLRRWTAPQEVMPASQFPEWIDRNHPQVWAPEVMEISGRYVLYFNARHRTLTRTETPPEGPRVLQRHCLGAAVADRPEGPFTGVPEPLVCAEFPHGVIDASPFRDGDSLYLYYKEDGNCCSPSSAMYVQGMSPDGLAAVGAPTRLLSSNDSPGREDNWEWRVVEAPTMVRRQNHYYLFYTGNHFGNRNYSVGYLRCATPRGPCTDPGENPILWSHLETDLIGPGHQSILERGGRTYAFFHGWNRDPDRQRGEGPFKRCLYVSQVSWTAGPGGAETAVIAGGEPVVMPPPVD
jgi:beta-xylosidase